ncbi:hypothetical protein Q9L58_010880, partial [Maublancomyces gigas]
TRFTSSAVSVRSGHLPRNLEIPRREFIYPVDGLICDAGKDVPKVCFSGMPPRNDPGLILVHARLEGFRSNQYAAWIDGLSALVEAVIKETLESGAIFGVRGKRSDRSKLLWWATTASIV